MTATINASTSAGVVTTADTSGILQLQTNGTAALTIDASQNVGIGTASPVGLLDVVSSGSGLIRMRSSTGGGAVGFQAQNSDTGTTATDGTFFGIDGSEQAYVYNYENAPILFGTNNTERARIDSSGQFFVGTTSNPGGGTSVAAFSGADVLNVNNTVAGTGSVTSVYFKRNATTVGSITVTGSATAYVTSSDYRLKENIAPMTGALAKVAALKPVTYKWKIDGSDGQGFIAHELNEVVPDCVSGEKDAVDADGNPKYQGIDVSFLVATLTAAIQEQQAIIESLKARLDAANL